ncbi:MAG: hypothetical protein ABIQ56_03970 [Chitinophagaceae bacterium]
MKWIGLIAGYFVVFGGCMQQGTGKPQTVDGNETGTAGNSNKGIEYIIFGRYCGRCISGKCAPMYKADFLNKKITLDNSSNYTAGKPLAFTTELPAEKFNLVSKLDTYLPDSLFLTTEKRFGCPDCADQCGIYLEIKKAGKKYDFELDTKASHMNGYIINIATKLQEIINQLQD